VLFDPNKRIPYNIGSHVLGGCAGAQLKPYRVCRAVPCRVLDSDAVKGVLKLVAQRARTAGGAAGERDGADASPAGPESAQVGWGGGRPRGARPAKVH
jgi:hypothetical protein